MFLEINVKNKLDLDKYCKTLKAGLYSSCSITCKKNNFDLAQTLSVLTKIEGIEIVPTFSVKANYDQNVTNTYKHFLTFVNIIKSQKINQILLVSGNPKMKLDTLAILKRFDDPEIKIAIAYNPYSKDLETDNQRLVEKLKYPNVNQVWLQLGQDCDKLNAGVRLIRQINPQTPIINSVLLPTKNLLQALRFRPWSGVYYTDQFYNNLDFALQNTEQIKQLSKDLNLEILISGT